MTAVGEGAERIRTFWNLATLRPPVEEPPNADPDYFAGDFEEALLAHSAKARAGLSIDHRPDQGRLVGLARALEQARPIGTFPSGSTASMLQARLKDRGLVSAKQVQTEF